MGKLTGMFGARCILVELALAIMLMPCPLLLAADTTAIEIGPGAKAMSAEEKAMAADPAKGSQHGVILVDESVRDESPGTEIGATTIVIAPSTTAPITAGWIASHHRHSSACSRIRRGPCCQ